MPTYLTTSDAARLTGLDQEEVRKLCRQGALKGAFQKEGKGAWYIPEPAAQSWLEKHPNPADPSSSTAASTVGDTITVSGISDSQVAVGRGSSVTVSQGLSGEDLSKLFSQIYQKIDSRPPDPDVDKQEVQETVQNIENEAKKGEQANANKVERWLKTLALIAPDIFEVTVATLTSPAAGIAAVIRKVVEKARQESTAAP